MNEIFDVMQRVLIDQKLDALHQWLECVPSENEHWFFLSEAIRRNNVQAVDVLMTHNCQHSEEALVEACSRQNMTLMMAILKYCDPQQPKNDALYNVCVHQDQKMFDVLYPLSDPEEVLAKLDHFDLICPMLNERLHIEHERALLNMHVAEGPPRSTRKI